MNTVYLCSMSCCCDITFKILLISIDCTSHGHLLNAMLHPLQASPSNPDNFPFVVLGNKADSDAGNSRAVCKAFPQFLTRALLWDF